MAILVATNRNIANRNRTDSGLFGDRVNTKGPSEIRLAWAQRVDGRWRLELVPEPDRLRETNRPSRLVFAACRDSLQETGRHCSVYVHGYNQEFEATLNQADELRQRYGLAIMLFSWPSNPGGLFISEYARAQAIARNSCTAFARILDLLARYLRETGPRNCDTSFNLIAHSLGNLLIEEFIRAPLFATQVRIFDNLILHQADVDLDGHADWIDRVRMGRRVYVTINERDKVLDLSDVINPDRLGNTVRNLTASRAVYVDFTHAPNVGTIHQLFSAGAQVNADVQAFFMSALHGDTPERGTLLAFDPRHNTHTIGHA